MPLSANDQATPSDAVPRKPRRRWLRFSLRTLLILVTLLSIGLGWFVHRGERRRGGREEVGGMVFYDVADGADRCAGSYVCAGGSPGGPSSPLTPSAWSGA